VNSTNCEAPQNVDFSVFAKERVAKCDKQQALGTNSNKSKTIFMLKLIVGYVWEKVANFQFRSLSSCV
jgi:hypothetical protein